MNCTVSRFYGATSEKYPRIKDATYYDLVKNLEGKSEKELKYLQSATEWKIKDRVDVSINGENRMIMLPNARRLSRNLHYNAQNTETSPASTHLVMQMGQFVDHDLSLAPERGKYRKKLREKQNDICSDGVDCCGNFRDTRSICAPIDILQQDFDEDDIYNSFKKGSTTLQRLQTCIPFARSLQNCESAVERKREQFNSLTAFLDLSSVYGNEPFVTKGRGQIEKKV